MSSPIAHAELMPPALTAFERYMWDDDRPGWPMTFVIRLRFNGPLDADKVARLLRWLCRRHPLLAARLELKPRPHWVCVSGFVPPLHRDLSKEASQVWGLESVDMLRTPAFAAALNGDDLLLRFHHSACDGIGMLDVLRDFLVGYARLHGERYSLTTLHPEDLARRGDNGNDAFNWWGRAFRGAAAAWRIVQYMALRPSTLARDVMHPEAAVDSPRQLLSFVLPASTTSCLLRRARSLGVTLNDLLICDFACTLHRHRSIDGVRRSRLRFMIPVNLRAAAVAAMSAGNCVGMVHLDVCTHPNSTPESLLGPIASSMRFNRRWRLGLASVLAVEVGYRLLGNIAPLLPVRTCYTTTALSNLGPILTQTGLPQEAGRVVVGPVQLLGFEMTTVVRPTTPLTVVAHTYAGELGVQFTIQPAQFDAAAAEELLNGFRQTLLASAK